MWGLPGVPHTSCPIFPGFSPLFCSPVALVPPGAQGTIMVLLSQGRSPWFPNCGVVQTQQNMGVYSAHTDLSANFSPLYFHCTLLVPPPPHSCTTPCTTHPISVPSAPVTAQATKTHPVTSLQSCSGVQQWGEGTPDMGALLGQGATQGAQKQHRR